MFSLNSHQRMMGDPRTRLDYLKSRLSDLRARNDSISLTQTETFVIRGQIEEIKLLISKEIEIESPRQEDAGYE